jgi:hypothetical protein
MQIFITKKSQNKLLKKDCIYCIIIVNNKKVFIRED